MGFDASAADERVCLCCAAACAAAYFLTASKNEKAGFCSFVGGGSTTILGIPKAFFTASFLITERIIDWN